MVVDGKLAVVDGERRLGLVQIPTTATMIAAIGATTPKWVFLVPDENQTTEITNTSEKKRKEKSPYACPPPPPGPGPRPPPDLYAWPLPAPWSPPPQPPAPYPSPCPREGHCSAAWSGAAPRGSEHDVVVEWHVRTAATGTTPSVASPPPPQPPRPHGEP
jgi:hypothetical protein